MKYVYLDYAAGRENPSSIHMRGVHAKDALSRARKEISQILNCHDYEVYFMPNSTYSIATALTTADYIITSNIEHTAVLGNIKKYKHLILKVESDGILRPDTLRQALRDTPLSPSAPSAREGKHNVRVLVTIMYANNEIGTIQKSKEYGRIIDQHNREHNLGVTNRVLYHIDGSQASRYLDLDVRKLRCDMLTVNSSKCDGPTGIALLYIKEDIKVYVKPLIVGGSQERGMYSGTENVAGAIGFATALTHAQSIKVDESARLLNIRDIFIKKFNDDIAFHIYGSIEQGERLVNNINIRVSGIPSDEMVIRLDAMGFAVSHQSACSAQDPDGYVLKAIGATNEESNENIRITMGPDTTMDDMDALYTAIMYIYKRYSPHVTHLPA